MTRDLQRLLPEQGREAAFHDCTPVGSITASSRKLLCSPLAPRYATIESANEIDCSSTFIGFSAAIAERVSSAGRATMIRTTSSVLRDESIPRNAGIMCGVRPGANDSVN